MFLTPVSFSSPSPAIIDLLELSAGGLDRTEFEFGEIEILRLGKISILEAADGEVRDHYTRYKVAQSGGTWFLSTLCIIFWESVISNLTIQGLQYS